MLKHHHNNAILKRETKIKLKTFILPSVTTVMHKTCTPEPTKTASNIPLLGGRKTSP